MAKQRSETVTEGKGGIIPWRPFGEMARWERDMERLLGNFFTGSGSLATREPNLNLDLYEEKDQIVVKAEMPGFTRDDIQISIADNALTIKGEKKKEEEDSGKDYYRSERVYGAFTRILPLPAEINPDKVQATFKNGVLEIRLPKSEDAKKKEIKVKVQS